VQSALIALTIGGPIEWRRRRWRRGFGVIATALATTDHGGMKRLCSRTDEKKRAVHQSGWAGICDESIYVESTNTRLSSKGDNYDDSSKINSTTRTCCRITLLWRN
jgi:hypothetical protein